MIVPVNQLISSPVMSIQTGKEIAVINNVLVDPDSLKIIAFILDGPNLDQYPSFLRLEDIRELSDIGFIVDSSDEFIGLDDVIKIKDIFEEEFDLVGMTVIDTHRQKIGTVNEIFFSTLTFEIEQLSVLPPLMKRFTDSEKLIHTSQIKKITDDTIIVRSPEIRIGTKQSRRKNLKKSKIEGSLA